MIGRHYRTCGRAFANGFPIIPCRSDGACSSIARRSVTAIFWSRLVDTGPHCKGADITNPNMKARQSRRHPCKADLVSKLSAYCLGLFGFINHPRDFRRSR